MYNLLKIESMVLFKISADFELSDEQKAFLDSQDNIQWLDCMNHEDLVDELKKEFGFN
jgi:hypothetical protein